MNRQATRRSLAAQCGATAVEFALTAIMFFIFVFGVIELARAMYMWSTMVEVTRRAARFASAVDFNNEVALTDVKHRAMFANLPGGLPLRGDVSENNLSIDYLNGYLDRVEPLPACPEQNIINCNLDPEGASCIRFVRVRLCVESSGASCSRVDYVPLVGVATFPGGPLRFPTFATVTPVTTLGYQPGGATSCL